MQSVIPHHPFEYTLSPSSECEQVSFTDSTSAHPRSYDPSGQNIAHQRATPRSAIGGHTREERLPSTSPMFATAGHGPMSHHPSLQSLSLHASNGFEYRPPASGHSAGPDGSFSTGGELSLSPMQSSRGSSSASPNSLTSNYALLSHHQGQYTLNANPYNLLPQGNPSTNPLFSPGASYAPNMLQSSLDLRTRLSALSAGAPVPPAARAPGDHIPSSPPGIGTIRNEYVAGPQAARSAFSGQGSICQLSPTAQTSLANVPRSMESALGTGSSSSGFLIGPHDTPLPPISEGTAPPFGNTRTFVTLRDHNGHSLQADITARIEKGFFPVFGEWVCYRRNYFTVLCAFDLGPANTGSEPVFVQRSGNQMAQIRSFSLTIAAKADGEDGKSIDLVQHTPKRDKGPMTAPDRKEVKPNPSGSLASAAFQPGSATAFGLNHQDFDRPSMPELDNLTVASFERIQFKKATANNGKRRAAQQYFYIIVELYGKIKNGQGQEENVKIAHQVSSKIVVRGRSPGHYQDERRPQGPHGGGTGQFGYHDNPYGHGGPLGSALSTAPGDGLSRAGLSGGQSTLGRSQFFHHGYRTPSASILHGSNGRSLSDDLMDVDSNNEHQFPSHQDFGGIPTPPTPRASQALRHSSNNSPTHLPVSGITYLTPLSVKEEMKFPNHAEDGRSHGLQTPFPQSPPWGLQRDCRTLGLQTPRDMYAEIV